MMGAGLTSFAAFPACDGVLPGCDEAATHGCPAGLEARRASKRCAHGPPGRAGESLPDVDLSVLDPCQPVPDIDGARRFDLWAQLIPEVKEVLEAALEPLRQELESKAAERHEVLVELLQEVRQLAGFSMRNDTGLQGMQRTATQATISSVTEAQSPSSRTLGTNGSPFENLESSPSQGSREAAKFSRGKRTRSSMTHHTLREHDPSVLHDMKSKADLVVQNVSRIAPDKRSWVNRFVQTRLFTWSVWALIIANSVFIGVDLQITASHVHDDTPTFIIALRYFFIVVFFSELLFRSLAERGHFLIVSEERAWNIFDSILFACSVVQLILEITVESFEETLPRSYLATQIFGFLRVFRILRVVRHFTKLRKIMVSLYGAATEFLWVMLPVSVIVYVAALTMTQSAIDNQREATWEIEELIIYFGRVHWSVYSLFQAFTGGDDWWVFAAPLFQLGSIGIFYFMVFIAYMLFMFFVVVNIVTAIFVESAVKTVQLDKDYVIKQEMAQEAAFVEEMKAVFRKADADGNGTMSFAEMETYLSNEEVRLRLKALGLEIDEATQLFELLDVEDQGEIDCDEFALGCLRLRGNARSIDTRTIMITLTRLENNLQLHTVHRAPQQHGNHPEDDSRGNKLSERLPLPSSTCSPADMPPADQENARKRTHSTYRL